MTLPLDLTLDLTNESEQRFNAQAEAAQRHLTEHDGRLGRVIERVGRLTLKPERRYFYALVSSIISQQISTKAADAIEKRFLALFGGGTAQDVTPELVAAVPKESLRAAGLSGQKARYVVDLAEKVSAGTVNLDHTYLEQLEDEAIIAQLTQVKGIGRWTVEMFLIFSLGRPDVLPVDDLGFRSAVHRLYQLEERPTPKQLRQFAAERGWSPHASAATWYLWRSLNLKLEELEQILQAELLQKGGNENG